MRRSRSSTATYFAFVRLIVARTAANGRGYTVMELAKRFEISHSTAWTWVKHLRGLDLVYVKKWVRAGNIWVAVYAWGFEEEDAPRPVPLTQAQHEKNYRARLKAKRDANGIAVVVGHLT